ncbi:hypothetical protein [Sphingomonas aquatilis]
MTPGDAQAEAGWTDLDRQFYDGYRDGGDPDAPAPNANRHPAYRHSFAVRRAEIAGQPMPAAVSRAAAAAIEADYASLNIDGCADQRSGS